MEPTDQPTEESELSITKSGAAENRRVRKRRVRPAKETIYAIELHRQKLRFRLMLALCGIVILAITIGIIAWYPGTENFRVRLDRMVVNSTGAGFTLENGTFSAFHAGAERLEMQWPEGNVIQGLVAEDVAATVMPQRYFSRIFGGDEIRAASGTLRLQVPDVESPRRVTDGAGGKSRIGFERIGIPKLDIVFGNPDSGSAAIMRETEAAFYPEGVNGVPRALIYSGSLELPSWPRLIIERGIVDFPPGLTRLTSLRFRDVEPDLMNRELLVGNGELTGEFSNAMDQPVDLELSLDGFLIQALIGEEAGRIFIGRVDTTANSGSGAVRFTQEDGLQLRADLVANSRSQLTFNHFPFLAFLSRSVDDRWFMNPIFEEAPTLSFRRSGAAMLFDDIDFTASNRMAIRGAFSINGDGEIDGQIEVGLSPIVIDASIARRLDGMFSPVREDFRWVRLQLGGTTSAPTDNFNALFIDAPLPEVELPIAPPPAPPQEPEPEPEEIAPPVRETPPSVLPLLDLDDE